MTIQPPDRAGFAWRGRFRPAAHGLSQRSGRAPRTLPHRDHPSRPLTTPVHPARNRTFRTAERADGANGTSRPLPDGATGTVNPDPVAPLARWALRAGNRAAQSAGLAL